MLASIEGNSVSIRQCRSRVKMSARIHRVGKIKVEHKWGEEGRGLRCMASVSALIEGEDAS